MTAHSELIEKVKYCRRLSPHEFELLQSEIIAALFDTLQISREDAKQALAAIVCRADYLRPLLLITDKAKRTAHFNHLVLSIIALETAVANISKALEAK